MRFLSLSIEIDIINPTQEIVSVGGRDDRFKEGIFKKLIYEAKYYMFFSDTSDGNFMLFNYIKFNSIE